MDTDNNPPKEDMNEVEEEDIDEVEEEDMEEVVKEDKEEEEEEEDEDDNEHNPKTDNLEETYNDDDYYNVARSHGGDGGSYPPLGARNIRADCVREIKGSKELSSIQKEGETKKPASSAVEIPPVVIAFDQHSATEKPLQKPPPPFPQRFKK
ncbi:pre-rRNA-processing protein ESF2-like [Cannabis sativa]|uniref:pre-rRNA-processing protein ESF2-like n=1 Tax=Cannabis sativa TaxID=3483 RepID=UPI0011DF3E1A|nr:pre-rRNA-processing protein ESF2-like [Cannabis sativa]